MNYFSQGGFKNKIINGCMRLAQRGTSIAVPQSGNDKYTLDRYFMQCSHDAGNITVTQDTSVPNNNFQYSLKATNAAGNDTGIGASQYLTLQQRVEGYSIAPLRNSIATLSFWVKSSKIGIYGIAFLSAGVDRSYIREYTVNVANTWEYKQVNVDLNAVVGGTWNYTNGIGLLVYFTLVAGTTFHTTKDAWQTGTYFTTANQVNWLNETNTFYITGVQLEQGAVATGFEIRDYGSELRLCQRYLYRINADQVSPSNVTLTGLCTSASYAGVEVDLPVSMRAIPVIGQGGTWVISTDGGNYNATWIMNAYTGNKAWIYATRGSGSHTAGKVCNISANAVTDYISLEAEL